MPLQGQLDDELVGAVSQFGPPTINSVGGFIGTNVGSVFTISAGATQVLTYNLLGGVIPNKTAMLSFFQLGVSKLFDWQTQAGIVAPNSDFVALPPSPAICIGSAADRAMRVMPTSGVDPDETVTTTGGYSILPLFKKWITNRACLGWINSNGKSLVSSAINSRVAIECAWLVSNQLFIQIRCQATTGGPFLLDGNWQLMW
jgi:hypothetical protein